MLRDAGSDYAQVFFTPALYVAMQRLKKRSEADSGRVEPSSMN